ncbi:hypothetical protein MettiDRAFT_2947 [Methanolobus tindarius DSM 2278]|uniref:Uncharacterized protein n=1 Tax=Methanolobus tindarius DSM 2278 TaxID=1090322 RepID=W9E1F4_METTI|nr:hypothetical protein MettiDRAFT_2947 [Methanolobus tindarius DSM 2278]
MIYEYLFLFSLFLTIIIETSVLFLLIRFYFKIDDLSNSLLLFAGIFSSFSTIPYLWFLLPQFIDSYQNLALIGEISVFLVEAVIYYFVLKVTVQRALILSFTCNLVSFIVGLMVF